MFLRDKKNYNAKEVIESLKNDSKELESQNENIKEILEELEKYRDILCCYKVGEKSYVWG